MKESSWAIREKILIYSKDKFTVCDIRRKNRLFTPQLLPQYVILTQLKQKNITSVAGTEIMFQMRRHWTGSIESASDFLREAAPGHLPQAREGYAHSQVGVDWSIHSPLKRLSASKEESAVTLAAAQWSIQSSWCGGITKAEHRFTLVLCGHSSSPVIKPSIVYKVKTCMCIPQWFGSVVIMCRWQPSCLGWFYQCFILQVAKSLEDWLKKT